MKKDNFNIKFPFPPLSLDAVKSELSTTILSDNVFNLSFKKYKKLCAFTLAEILLSLSIIGIVAAIALPSLLGNVNERAFETQKKALYTRFSQSIPLLPSLNGYGTLEGTLSHKEGNTTVPQNVTVDTAAETFVRDGLSKVMKITNICDSEHLTDCGLPDKIIPLNNSTAINLSDIKSMLEFNNKFSVNLTGGDGTNYVYEHLNTKAAAFETVNGESILIYYNPNCEPDFKERIAYYIQPKLCANLVYDLNGKKGPNTVGKDIGFISALYSTDPVVVSPNLYPDYSYPKLTYNEAVSYCKEISIGAKLPNLEELYSIFCNRKILGISDIRYWSSIRYSSTAMWTVNPWQGAMGIDKTDGKYAVLCIKR